jgi:hypothetical protein
MAVPTQLSDLSVTISTNSPQPTDSTGSPSTVDDFFRAHAGLIAQVNAAKAPLASPTFTGHVTVEGVTATGATGTGKFVFSVSPTFTGTVSGVTAAMVGLGNVTNESKATMFTAPTFTGNVGVDTVTSVTGAKVVSAGAYEVNDGTRQIAVAPNYASVGPAIQVYSNHPLQFVTNNVERIRITEDGRLYGTALHNNAGAVTGTASQYIASGTYTPTLTNVAGASSSIAHPGQWIRVGNVVHVSGTLEGIASTTGDAMRIGISLPVASNFASVYDCAGCGAIRATVAGYSTTAAEISADTTNDRADMRYLNVLDLGDVIHYSFTYTVL